MTLSTLLRGKKVRLTAVTDDDIPTITRWYQDAAFMRLFDAMPARPRSIDSIKKMLEDHHTDKNIFLFAIRLLDSENLIGMIDIDGILWAHGTGWLGISIGDKANQGKGYGMEAIRLTLDFAFSELNLHRIQLTVFSYNTAAIKLYEKLGFTREGTFREFLHRDGKRYDMILYGILRHEWESPSA